MICQKAKRKSNDKKTRAGFSLLAYSMIGMILFFLMFFFDTMIVVFTDHPGYTIFIYLAWIFALLFMVLSYMSLVMPEWLIKLIEKKE